MNGRFTALLLASTLPIYGCVTERTARSSTSANRPSAEADSREGVERHFDRLLAQLHRLEQLEHRKQPEAAQSSRSVHGIRPFYVAYRRSFRFDGATVHDGSYYRLQHQVLDAFSAQLIPFERLFARLPNARKA